MSDLYRRCECDGRGLVPIPDAVNLIAADVRVEAAVVELLEADSCEDAHQARGELFAAVVAALTSDKEER